jgi:hypothetical protein
MFLEKNPSVEKALQANLKLAKEKALPDETHV